MENARRIAEEAVALHQVDQCPEGVFDVILDSSQLGLQIHESVGHPIELDRVLEDVRRDLGIAAVSPGARPAGPRPAIPVAVGDRVIVALTVAPTTGPP